MYSAVKIQIAGLMLILLAVLVLPCSAKQRPNIVILLVDDLGIADIGCFGNDTIRTPHIDKLAREGAALRHNLSPAPICTPSRAAFMTGRYAVRLGMAAKPEECEVFVHNAASGGLPQNETTFAELLSGNGYMTGLVGKWHLGLNLASSSDFHFHPLKHGFNHFYGIPLTNFYGCEPQGVDYILPNLKPLTLTALIVLGAASLLKRHIYIKIHLSLLLLIVLFYAFLLLIDLSGIVTNCTCLLMRGFDVVEQPVVLENLTTRLTDDAIKFMRKSHPKPFLLLMSYVKVHTPLFTSKPFQGHSKHGSYGDNVEELDWSVGQIMKELDDLGLRNETFVYFTSDHGPHLHQFNQKGKNIGGWKGNFRGGKGNNWEGGIRVPTLVRWPSHIESGINITEPTNNFDIFSTIADMTGIPEPADRIIDGKSLLPLLTKQEEYSAHEFMYHYCGKDIHAVRYRPKRGKSIWKAVFKTPNPAFFDVLDEYKLYGCYGDKLITHKPTLLFDLTADPSESNPLVPTKPHYNEIMKHINKAIKHHQDTIAQVPNQLSKNIWYPWLQVCCNFPLCSCVENNTEFVYPKLT
ncbi:predicted protein [Nematostella vectensis]|uniref:Sulfatase N-terminal domain-containing protein n=1 Tax=Nematostella vectensis TaxID=45351 RepID=A7SK49_NEMVE|nr:predicted protein [Nematostella vectensis]|eukprot:XP_001627990.1 predicted protein [Nematostella vectensis]